MIINSSAAVVGCRSLELHFDILQHITHYYKCNDWNIRPDCHLGIVLSECLGTILSVYCFYLCGVTLWNYLALYLIYCSYIVLRFAILLHNFWSKFTEQSLCFKWKWERSREILWTVFIVHILHCWNLYRKLMLSIYVLILSICAT